MRMSDILRGGFGKEETPGKKPLEPPVAPPQEPPPPLQIRPKEPIAPPKIPAGTLYNNLLEFVETRLFVGGEHQVSGLEIQAKIEPVVDRVTEEAWELMYLAVTRSTPDCYLHAHVVNVTILALRLGSALGYDREALLKLGVGALLHDIGMIRVIDIAQKKGPLTPEEFEEIKRHPQYSVDLLKEVKDLPSLCLNIIETVHERQNGKGYPHGLRGSELSEEAQIVTIVDVYEALTHVRSYRDKFLPYEALKEILKTKELFHPKILKTFVQYITVYPIGCWVELSTGEMGQVVNVNIDLPLRPTLKISYDDQMHPLKSEKQLNLAQHSTLYVKRVLDEKELGQKREKGRW